MPALMLVVFVNFIGTGKLVLIQPYMGIEILGLSAPVMTLLLPIFYF